MGTPEKPQDEELEKKITEIAEAFASQAASATFARIKQMLYQAISQERSPDQNIVELKYVVELVGKVHLEGNNIVSVAGGMAN
jgi:hypothetical protein